jgi:hypothetical protein
VVLTDPHIAGLSEVHRFSGAYCLHYNIGFESGHGDAIISYSLMHGPTLLQGNLSDSELKKRTIIPHECPVNTSRRNFSLTA